MGETLHRLLEMQINRHRLPDVLHSQNEGQGEPIKATTVAQQHCQDGSREEAWSPTGALT